jgi:predicted ester cyclase
MSVEENKMLVRRQFDEIWNGGNWATVDELYAPDYVNHDPYNPDQGTGPEGFKQRVGGYRSVLHDFDLRIERQIGEGDWVETHWSLRGNHGGELEGTAPTGKSVYVDGQLLSHIVDGKFVEEWVHWNTLGSPAPQGVTARAGLGLPGTWQVANEDGTLVGTQRARKPRRAS